MKMCYKKLWKLLIEKDLKKKDLQALAGISSASITKMGKNENINTGFESFSTVSLAFSSGPRAMREWEYGRLPFLY